MVSTDDAIAPQALAEKRISLHDISWQTYETISNALGDRRSPRLTYYQGTLEIMTLLEPHESASELIGDFIEILVESGLNIKSLGSTTLNRPDLGAGAEPDKCYYIQNEPLVRGRIVDLETDPPPDLVVEIDITPTDINKKALYEQMGVPEFWHYDGSVMTLYLLQDHHYQEVQISPTFSWVQKEALYQFLQDCNEQGETKAKQNLRDWARDQFQLLGMNG